jgi:glutamate-1-semialdehyde 2,1-aminomutase
VPASAAHDTLTVPAHDLAAVRACLAANRGEVAALIVEPVFGNMGCVPPAPGWLEGLRELTLEHGTLLVFDEVITGFRVARGGAQARFGVRPDLTCLGKIAGGGLPVGVYGGRADVMERVAPLGPVYQAGTLSGNPLAMAAGLATLARLAEPGVYERLEALGDRLAGGLSAAARSAGVPATVNRVGSMLTAFFTGRPVADYASAKTADTRLYARFFRGLLARGVMFAPAQFECAFVSLAHREADVDATVAAAREAMAEAAG